MFIQSSKGSGGRRPRIVGRVNDDGGESPEGAGKDKCKGAKGSRRMLASICASQFLTMFSLPMQKVWQQLYAGYHEEYWKSDSIKRAKDTKKAQHDTRGYS